MRQPEFFTMNTDQTLSIIASIDDGMLYYYSTNQQLYIDIEKSKEMSSDNKEVEKSESFKVFTRN